MYQEQTNLEADNFANFAFPQQSDDINQSLPIVDNLLQPPPPTDLRAAQDFHQALATIIDNLNKFQDTISLIHSQLTSDQFPVPEVSHARVIELQALLEKTKEIAVSSGVAALKCDQENVNNTLWMNLDTMGQGGEDQLKINRTFQKTESLKRSANAVVSVLRRPNRDT